MSLVLKSLKTYAKLTLLVGMALVVLFVGVRNRNNTVNVWFFKSYDSINVLWLMLVTAVGSIVSWWILAASVGLWRDMKEMHAESERRKQAEEQRTLAHKLQEAEQRIDAKLKSAISNEASE